MLVASVLSRGNSLAGSFYPWLLLRLGLGHGGAAAGGCCWIGVSFVITLFPVSGAASDERRCCFRRGAAGAASLLCAGACRLRCSGTFCWRGCCPWLDPKCCSWSCCWSCSPLSPRPTWRGRRKATSYPSPPGACAAAVVAALFTARLKRRGMISFPSPPGACAAAVDVIHLFRNREYVPEGGRRPRVARCA